MSRGLLQPANLAGLTLPNRVVMAPMTRTRAVAGRADQLTVRYYEQRTSAGLIISEGTPISQEGTGYVSVPGLYTAEHITGWRRVTDAVRERDGRMFAQLWHVGRASHVSLQADGASPVSSTARDGDNLFAYRSDGTFGRVPSSMPRPLATHEVSRVVDDFAVAAANADTAGFHGVEIHAATRYLFEQFLNAAFNDRTDRYGAKTMSDRLRFTLDVVDAVVGQVGARRVGVRISPFSTVGNMPADDQAEQTYRTLIGELADRGIAYVHVHDTAYLDATIDGRVLNLLARVRPTLGGMAVVLAGGLTRQSAEQLIGEELIDFAAFGRPYISNPDLVERFRNGIDLADADADSFYGGGAEGYVDYDTASTAAAVSADAPG